MAMKLQNSNYLSIEQLKEQYLNPSKTNTNTKTVTADGLSFQDILKQKTAQGITDADAPLKFSRHAANRLTDRQIELTSSQMERLSEGAQRAGRKGIQESLVLVDQLAFIVNIPNHTVITAMDSTDSNENIFTNIDGAVIV